MIKVNVCLSETDAIDGYNNISINQLGTLVNGSIDELVFRNLDGISHEARISTVSDLLSKIKYDGSLTIEILDLMAIGKEMFNGSITSKSLSALLSGARSVGYEFDIVEQIANFQSFIIRNKYTRNFKLTIIITKQK